MSIGKTTKGARPLRAVWWLLGRVWAWLREMPGRVNGSFPKFPRELHRPAVFTLMFWSAFVLTFLVWPFLGANGVAATFYGVIPTIVVMATLYLLWRYMPWNPGAGTTRKLIAPAFLVGVFLLDRSVTGAGLMFYPIVFANGVFLFGFRRGIGYIAAVLAVIFVDTTMIVHVLDVSATTTSAIVNALISTVLFGLISVFVIGVCTSIIEAVQRREESEDLLSKLEAAHADLKEYTGRVRKLTVSEERARMAREMHDSVGHYLTVVNVQLEAASKFMDSGDTEKASAEVKKAKRFASEALSEVRRSVRALKPLAMDDSGSASDTLAGLVRDFKGNGPCVSFSVSGKEYALMPEVQISLYRTLQESLTNVLKHSDASSVEATLAFDPDSVHLTITDDGRGEPPGANDGGFGLKALSERAKELGGTLESWATPNGGYTVKVSLPVSNR